MDVKQKESIKKRIESHIISKDDCWIADYYISSVKNGKKQDINIDGKNFSLKRIVYEVYRGEIPESLWVYHECQNPLCVNPEHLFLGTRLENGLNQRRRNRQVKGSNTKGAAKSKFTESQIVEIKKLLFEQQLTIPEIAKLFNSSRSTIGNISRGLAWNHIEYTG